MAEGGGGLWTLTDAEREKRWEQTLINTLLVHACKRWILGVGV